MVCIIVQGGAWAIPAKMHRDSIEGCRRAALAGRKILKSGGSALDAVEEAVRSMESDPIYDAGRGTVLNMRGDIELDAMIMNGRDLTYGSVAAVKDILHPVSLARKVMEDTPHCMVAGEGANLLAERFGIDKCSPEELLTEYEMNKRKKIEGGEPFDLMGQFRYPVLSEPMRIAAAGTDIERESASIPVSWIRVNNNKMLNILEGSKCDMISPKGDTVGACALDADGNIATALSTGGTTNKYPGRVGDTPIAGCGGYADNHFGAVSSTGMGEWIMRYMLSARAFNELVNGSGPMEASVRAVKGFEERIGGLGGMIILSRDGRMGLAYNTPYMPYAWIECNGDIVLGI